MGKSLFIAEKPSVAQEFARTLGISGKRNDGYLESENAVVTWCVGHLVTMSYPEAYDPNLKKWSLETIPFIPDTWKYEIIDSVKKQFGIVKSLLNRKDVDTIYVCTDSGREGEYIYRLVRQEAGVRGKTEKRVWIDSQTEEEIKRGIREAKDLSAYDALASAAYLRAREDYLMGINFSRALTLKFGPVIANALRRDRAVLSVGRVMTCVLGMVVRREREIRDFKKTPFYRVFADVKCEDNAFEAEFRAVKGSRYFESPLLYRENGFKERKDAEALIQKLTAESPYEMTVASAEKKTENRRPPLLFNLAELQNECAKRFRKSPDETLKIVQELYEKKLVTYPRTDARVLSSAVAKEIGRNLSGLKNLPELGRFAEEILEEGRYKGIGHSMYTDDKKITDHYAIIPTGQGLGALSGLPALHKNVYELIVRRFLAIFFPAAVYKKVALELVRLDEHFFASVRYMGSPGYLAVWDPGKGADRKDGEEDCGKDLYEALARLKKGSVMNAEGFRIREGETAPPKRYTSGSLILAMENAGQLIEDEDLRAQIKGSGIGTSATRAEILKKLVTIKYLKINGKTQVVTPELLGELVYDTVYMSIRPLLNPDLTASWEKGLSYVAGGTIGEDEYMAKMSDFVRKRTEGVKAVSRPDGIRPVYEKTMAAYGR